MSDKRLGPGKKNKEWVEKAAEGLAEIFIKQIEREKNSVLQKISLGAKGTPQCYL